LLVKLQIVDCDSLVKTVSTLSYGLFVIEYDMAAINRIG